jgi:hypothetical protein
MPEISVVVRLYNKSVYTEQGLDAILDPPHSDFELIVERGQDPGVRLGSARGIAQAADHRRGGQL